MDIIPSILDMYFTEKELDVLSDHARIVFRSRRFFSDSDGMQEMTLSKYQR
jgi:hypothetical protein